jgi:hypothetical protein
MRRTALSTQFASDKRKCDQTTRSPRHHINHHWFSRTMMMFCSQFAPTVRGHNAKGSLPKIR